MKIAIGSDHAGFEIKGNLKPFLTQEGHEVIDVGTNNVNSCDYPDFALQTSLLVSQKKADSGILICGTGIGMSISANKVKGIRAAVCWNEEVAKLSREHNDCNVLCLGTRTGLDARGLEKIVDVWLKTKFEGGRHQKRVDKIGAIEQK